MGGSKRPAFFLTDIQSKDITHRLSIKAGLICQDAPLIRHSKRMMEPVPSTLVGVHALRDPVRPSTTSMSCILVENEDSVCVGSGIELHQDKRNVSAIRASSKTSKPTGVCSPSFDCCYNIQIERASSSFSGIVVRPLTLYDGCHKIPPQSDGG